ncbi:MAG TPA: alpha-2-macroglobulin family protein, partial [Flavisolibacter sp.]
YFPHDEYSNETDMSTWARTAVYNKTDSSRRNGQWAIGNGPFKPGYYMVEVVTKDKDGKEVKDARYLELFDPANGFNKPEYLWVKGSDKPIEPGEQTHIRIGSSAQQVYLVSQLDKKGEKGFTEIPIGQKGKQPIPVIEHKEADGIFQYTTINNEKKTFIYSATEADRGGYGVHFFFVKDNRFYQYGDIIMVPWSNKDLQVEYATFRDKTLPGSEEKWKVKISGYKGEQVAAEMLASMYDASLDQFRHHQWNKPGLWPVYGKNLNWNSSANFNSVESQNKWINDEGMISFSGTYDELLDNINNYLYYGYIGTKRKAMRVNAEMQEMKMAAPPTVGNVSANNEYYVSDSTMVMQDGIADELDNDKAPAKDEPIQVRKNFNETAFFFPDLRTDANGNIEFSFTAPEALTRWKIQALAHTKELAFGLAQKEMVTQKELMVQPNMPRFVRQGDRMEMVAKIVNLSDKELTGQAQLQLFDATTNQSVDGYFINTFPNQYFTVAAGQSESVKFPIQVPFQFNNALTWRIVARAGNFSDGEEMSLPVLTNKVLVTETLPMPVRGDGTKNFTFDKLLNSGESETLQHHLLSVEYTSNPAWYAVQALPYLMEYPYDCAEQTWNRYYANALASKIANSSPRIKQIFEQWRTLDTAALMSNLQKNEELKSALLEETPWVLQAETEAEQKKNIALLFDMVRMSNELKSNLEKLKQMQSANGGFVWFKGGPDDRYMTQYIVTGIGHLKKLGVETENLSSILKTALPYLDKKIKEDYDRLIKNKAKLASQQVSQIHVQYLYMRSFFPEHAVAAASKTAYNYYRKQSQQFWTKQNIYMQGMTALALNRTGDKIIPAAILK